MDKLYNIIIPNHNHPDLLERCLDSIPEREDIEVFVVDDNSDAQYIPTIKSICDRHSNVTCILTKEGLGAGYARNIGISRINSKWVLFVDADDYLLPDAFDALDKHIDDEADIIYFYSTCRFSDTNELGERHLQLVNKINRYIDCPNEKNEGILRYSYNEPAGKMIRASLITENNIQFEQTRWGNDVHFSTLIGAHAGTITADKSEIYCLTVAYGSLVHQHSLESRRCRYEVQLRNNKYLREIGKPQFQDSLMYSLRWAAHYGGVKTVWEFIKLGRKYNANFFVGANKWIRNFFISRKEYQGREKYITHPD